MKRLTTIALFAAAVVLAGCGKKDEKKPATTTAAPAAGSAAMAPAAGSAAMAPAAGSAAMAPAAGSAAMAPAAGSAAVDPAAAPAAGGPAPTDAEFQAMMGKAISMFESMGKAVDGAGDDCGKLAAGLNKVLDDNKDFLDTAKKFEDNPEMKAKGEEYMKANMDKVMGPMMKVGTAGQKCATDPAFAAFQKRFDEMN